MDARICQKAASMHHFVSVLVAVFVFVPIFTLLILHYPTTVHRLQAVCRPEQWASYHGDRRYSVLPVYIHILYIAVFYRIYFVKGKAAAGPVHHHRCFAIAFYQHLKYRTLVLMYFVFLFCILDYRCIPAGRYWKRNPVHHRYVLPLLPFDCYVFQRMSVSYLRHSVHA